MEKNTAIIIVSLLTLIIGFGAGYTIAWNKTPVAGTHMMNDSAMGMEGAMDNMMTGLDGRKGDDFDKEFLSEMIVHHQGAVNMAEAALADAKHPELKQMAQNIITAQNAEIIQMKAWQSAWFGAKTE